MRMTGDPELCASCITTHRKVAEADATGDACLDEGKEWTPIPTAVSPPVHGRMSLTGMGRRIE
jgi:hypothetical protein